MHAFAATELARMRSAQQSSMQDVCQIGRYQSTADAYNNPDVEYVYGGQQACGFEHLQPKEVQGTAQVPIIDARLRLPVGVDVDPRDRIRIEERYGEVLASPEVYEIEGPVRRGPSGLVLDLRLVDDGTGIP